MKIRLLVMTEERDPGDEYDETYEPQALYLIETGRAVAVEAEPEPAPAPEPKRGKR